MAGGYRNDYFYNRIDAAVALYKSKKISHIIVSGDNSAINYNEPKDMKDELLKKGIPDSAIVLDHAGFRTFDSVIRANEVFGQNTFIVISQKFHNERAIYIARKNNIDAYGFNAQDVDAYKGFKTKNREYLARVKVFLDLWLGTTPRFLGEKVEIK
ncbi:vancomycin high temperature exclusion protein [compost metagenome]